MCANQERILLGGIHAALAAPVTCILLLLTLTVSPTQVAQGQTLADSIPAPVSASTETDGTVPWELQDPTPPVAAPLAGQVESMTDLYPQLIRANLVPSVVDVTEGNRNVMAIAEIALLPKVQSVVFYLRPRGTNNPPTLTLAGTLISSTEKVGRWEALMSIPSGCLPGRWSLAVLVQPVEGPPVDFGPFGETPLPTYSAKELMVINSTGVDVSLPEVEVLKVDPQLAFVGCGDVATPVKIRLRVRSANGLDESDGSCVQLSRSDLSTAINGELLGEANRISGTALDGIYEATVQVHPYSQPGEFFAGAVARSRVGWPGKMVRPGPRVEVRSLKHLPRGYVEWASRHFPDSFRGPDPDCGSHAMWRPDADSDGDGVINCVEAYFGTSPTNRSDVPKILVSYDSRRQFVVNWTQPQNTYGMKVMPEWSADMDLWQASGEPVAGRKARTIQLSDEGPAPRGGVFMEARFDVSGLPHAYLRLRVLMP